MALEDTQVVLVDKDSKVATVDIMDKVDSDPVVATDNTTDKFLKAVKTWKNKYLKSPNLFWAHLGHLGYQQVVVDEIT